MENDNKHMEQLSKVTKSLIDRMDLIINAETCLTKQFSLDYKDIVKNGTKVVAKEDKVIII